MVIFSHHPAFVVEEPELTFLLGVRDHSRKWQGKVPCTIPQGGGVTNLENLGFHLPMGWFSVKGEKIWLHTHSRCWQEFGDYK